MLRLISAFFTLFVVCNLATAAEQNTMPSSVSLLPTFAQKKPAVDGLNGKLDIFGGAGQSNALSINSIEALSPYATNSSGKWNGIGGAVGTVTVPLGHNFGAQIDLGSGAFGNRANGSGAGHLFWRDPDYGLVGVYGSGIYSTRGGGRTQWNAAAELERYIGPITGKALLGAQGFAYNSSYNSSAYPGLPWNPNQPDRFFDKVSLSYYPIDDLALTIGHIYTRNTNGIHGEVEYILPQFRGGEIAPAVYVQGNYGWNNSSNIMAGLRIYFGNHDKSLIRRHREDDPANHGNLHQNDASVNNYAVYEGAEGNVFILRGDPSINGSKVLASFKSFGQAMVYVNYFQMRR